MINMLKKSHSIRRQNKSSNVMYRERMKKSERRASNILETFKSRRSIMQQNHVRSISGLIQYSGANESLSNKEIYSGNFIECFPSDLNIPIWITLRCTALKIVKINLDSPEKSIQNECFTWVCVHLRT